VNYLLGTEGHAVVERFAGASLLLAFDFDGTLAPLVLDPAEAALRSETRSALRQVAERYPTVVISGRALRDVTNRLSGLGLGGVSGNHGLEPWDVGEGYARHVRQWHRQLDASLKAAQGVWIEDKRFSLAIHYAAALDHRAALTAIRRAIGALGPIRVVGGKQVVNLLPDGAANKGVALERWRTQLKCERALYLGDDQTDEDVFALDQPEHLLSVRVGHSLRSRASYFIRNQVETDRLLHKLIAIRPDRFREERAGSPFHLDGHGCH
jgi:trehalose 6-phosphate phosphatase